MLSPSPGAQTAHSGGCRKVGSSVTTVAASTISRPGPASGAPPSAPQDSEPDQVTGSPGNSASSRRYSSVAVARSPAAGPVRTPDAPIQANEAAVTPAPGRPASTRVTSAPTMPAPTTTRPLLTGGLSTLKDVTVRRGACCRRVA